MSIHIDGLSYDIQALARRLAIGKNTIPPTGRKLSENEISQIWNAAEKIGWIRPDAKESASLYGVEMAPGSHSTSQHSRPSKHSQSQSSIGTQGWIARGYDKKTSERMHRRERRLRRMSTPSHDTLYSREYHTNSDSSGLNDDVHDMRNHIPNHRLPRHLGFDHQIDWAQSKAEHQIQKDRRTRRHARQELKTRELQKDVMLELRHAPPKTHHPEFPGGSNYHASKRRWNEAHEPTSKKLKR